MKIKIDDLSSPVIAEFLAAHLEDMRSVSPPESKHALDLDGLRQPDVTFWTIWDDEFLAGCGALKRLDHQHAELKSMRTSPLLKKRGVASTLLRHILQFACEEGIEKISLETGSMSFFEPARNLYSKFGFNTCPPFADYEEDPNSEFMSIDLRKFDTTPD
ncbi:MAG: GNAT family N-acetyltransferase [Acidiferrobacterales bacterium]|nr:GNAT family N-acetyltransferase [Acidiferrobacterales bacterium]